MVEDKKIKESQATAIVGLAEEFYEFFKSADGTAYAEIQTETAGEGIKVQTVPVKGSQFRNFLQALFFNRTGNAARRGSIDDAIGIILGNTQLRAPQQSVFVRLAESVEDDDDTPTVWLDLADKGYRAVKITASGWEVVSGLKIRVKFLRTSGMLPLPKPKKTNHSLCHLLRQFLNIADNNHRQLVMSWLAFTLRTKGAKPILCIEGEAGSAKTTACKILRMCVDPSEAMLIDLPRTSHDCVIAAQNSLVLAYDNVSAIPNWFSDTMCRMATGDGHRTRELYTDDSEKIFSAMRPQIVNSIEDVTYRGDFLDRSIRVILEPIPDHKRIGDRELEDKFREYLPSILGALCDVISASLRDHVTLAVKPRMADFAEFSCTIEEQLGFGSGNFKRAYDQNRREVNNLVLSANPVAYTLLRVLKMNNDHFKGSTGSLLVKLNDAYTDTASDTHKRPKQWPTSIAELTSSLRRVAPSLRRRGYEMERKSSNGKRFLVIRKIEKQQK